MLKGVKKRCHQLLSAPEVDKHAGYSAIQEPMKSLTLDIHEVIT